MNDEIGNYADNEIKRHEIEHHEKWRDWIDEIPIIHFPLDWGIKVIPPFGGAMARFQVIKDEAKVSVYLDVLERLGLFGEPYWGVYPYDDDVYRIPMKETRELIAVINKSLMAQGAHK